MAKLTERIRTATKRDHDKSDRVASLKIALILTSPRLYGEALSLFLPIYERIESILERRSSHPQLGKITPLLPKLRRGPGFRSDVVHYVPADRRVELEERRAEGEPAQLAEYVERLDALENADPVRILAYVYCMYMAIFAGGYIIKKMVIKAMGLPRDGSDGVEAFCFEEGLNVKEVAKELKRILNEEVPMTEEEAGRIVQEAAEVFRMNNALMLTVKRTDAWRIAAQDCTRWVTRPLLASLGVAIAAYAYWRWFSDSQLDVAES